MDIAATETLILSVSTPENWWQLGAHPKSAAETLTFYSVEREQKGFEVVLKSLKSLR